MREFRFEKIHELRGLPCDSEDERGFRIAFIRVLDLLSSSEGVTQQDIDRLYALLLYAWHRGGRDEESYDFRVPIENDDRVRLKYAYRPSYAWPE